MRRPDRRRSRALFAVLVLWGPLPAAASAQQSRGALLGRIDSVVASEMARTKVPGVSVAVAERGHLVLAKGYGWGNIEADDRASAETVYRIGSITKQFTAVGIMQLVEQGKIGLDDEITRFLPDYRTGGRKVTLRHLLTHTSGIKSYTSLGAKFWSEAARLDLSNDRMLALFRDEPFDFDPGEKYLYNNSAYFILGVIIEKVSGQPYRRYLQENILEPLGLRATSYCDDTAVIPHRAAGYGIDEGKLVNAAPISMYTPGAAGAICSTVLDLVAWQRAFNEDKLISAASREKMRTPAVLNNGQKTSYGFGLGVAEFEGRRSFSHAGGVNGFVAWLAHFPDDDLTVAVLTNSGGGPAPRIGQLIGRIMLGIPLPLVADLPVDAATRTMAAGTYDLGQMKLVVRVGPNGRLEGARQPAAYRPPLPGRASVPAGGQSRRAHPIRYHRWPDFRGGADAGGRGVTRQEDRMRAAWPSPGAHQTAIWSPMMRRWTTVTILFSMAWISSGEAQRGLTAEQAALMRTLGTVRISPDGRWVAYSVSVANLENSSTNTDIWLVAAGGGEPIRLTTDPANDDQPRWSPDGRTVAFVSSREGKPQLFRISAFGGEAEKLTESKTGVGALAWSPDGRTIAFVAPRDPTPEEERKQKEKDDALVVDRDFTPSRLFLFDVAARKATELVKGEFQIGDPQWSPDGRQIAFVSTPTPKADDSRHSDILIAEVATGATRKLIDNPGPDGSPRWSPDGSLIAFDTRPAKNAGVVQPKLAVVSSSGGVPRVLAPDFLYAPGPVTWSPDGQTLYFWSSVRTRNELFAQPVGGGGPERLSDLKGSTGFFGGGGPSISSDGRYVAFGRSDLEHPPEVYLAELRQPWTHRALTKLNPELESVAMGRGEVVRWKSRDGMEIEGIVVYPVGYDPSKRYPTVVQVHGGPSGVWPEAFGANWYGNAQVYAGQGWVSFLPNPRGSSGYGDKFLMANYRDWGGGDYRDIQSGVDDLIRRGIADSTKLAQTGWSYGGYMTAWTLTQTNRFKAVMVGAGLTNMYSMYSTNDLQTLLEEYFGAEPWDDEQAYRRASAMMFIKQAKTPTLILHGQLDTRVPIGQAQELYMGLRKNDVPVTLVFYPREGHGLQEPRHGLDKMKREYAFFSKHVLGVEVKDRPDLVP